MQNMLRKLREAVGLTQAELATRCNTTNQQISRLENGQVALNDRWLRVLGAALYVNPSEILIFDDDAVPSVPVPAGFQDLDCLRQAIETAELALHRSKRVMAPKARAHLVFMIYELFKDDPSATSDDISSLVS